MAYAADPIKSGSLLTFEIVKRDFDCAPGICKTILDKEDNKDIGIMFLLITIVCIMVLYVYKKKKPRTINGPVVIELAYWETENDKVKILPSIFGGCNKN